MNGTKVRKIKIRYIDGDSFSTLINGTVDEILEYCLSYNEDAYICPNENKIIEKIDFYDETNKYTEYSIELKEPCHN